MPQSNFVTTDVVSGKEASNELLGLTGVPSLVCSSMNSQTPKDTLIVHKGIKGNDFEFALVAIIYI